VGPVPAAPTEPVAPVVNVENEVDPPLVPTLDPLFSPASSSNDYGPTGGVQTAVSCPGCSPVPVSPNVPILHSKPGAAKHLMLDFDGHCFPSDFLGYCPGQTVPFSLDSIKDTSFTPAEIQYMKDIWLVVAEDYAPFDVDVTTQEPATWSETTDVRVVFDDRSGGQGGWFGAAWGGYAYSIGAFGNSDPNIAYVWYENSRLIAGGTTHEGTVASHEAGHLYGLNHYDESDGFKASIMRNGYAACSRNIWRGLAVETLSGATVLGTRPSDHGDTIGAATQATESGSALSAAGIMETATDVDMFRVNVPIGGMVNAAVNVVPRAEYSGAGYLPERHFANLDSKLTLLNSAGNQATDATGALVPASAPTAIGLYGYGARIAARLNAGTYYLKVQSTAVLGDLGAYTITGTRPDPSPSTNAPRVTAVVARKTGSAGGDHAVPGGNGVQLATVPRGGVNQISISFSEGVSVQQDDLVIKRQGGSGATVPTTGFAYDSPNATATWTLDSVHTEQLLLTLKGTGATAVLDGSGWALDGEWTNPNQMYQHAPATSTFPSGNGAAGGDFVFRLTLLAGDHDCDGDVDDADYTALNNNFGTGTTWEQGDYDGDGDVDLTDFGLLSANYNAGTNYRVWP
jgi:hypothetical protein